MSQSLTFGPSNQAAWLQLRQSSNPFSAVAGPLPQINVPLELRAMREGVEADVLRLALRLSLDGVLLGHGELGPLSLGNYDYNAICTVLLASDALALVTDPPTTGRVQLKLDLHGLLRFRHSRDDINTAGLPPAGEWEIVSVQQGTGQSLDLSVARSDWYDQVIEPLGLRRYFTHLLYLPDPAHIGSWRGALERLDDAAQALARGDHPQVFSQCRGALDALPGNKTAIFATMPDGARRSAIDALTRSVGAYLHSGRHVVPDGGGEMEGDFPVQASDATFAYRLTQLLMSHIARLTHTDVA